MATAREVHNLSDMTRLPEGKLRSLLDRWKLQRWADHKIVLPKGDRLDWASHTYLPAIYNDLSIKMCAIKGAQLGFSTHAIIKSIWTAAELNRNVIYTMPTSDDVTQHTAARIDPIISNSPYIRDRLESTDSVRIKKFSALTPTERFSYDTKIRKAQAEGDEEEATRLRRKRRVGTIYFRGTGVASGGNKPGSKAEREAATADSDFDVHDELDKSNPRTHQQYGERLTASQNMGWEYNLSTPRWPGQMIDAEYTESDQHVWMIRCSRCRFQFELRFPGQPVEKGMDDYHNLSIEPDRFKDHGAEAKYVCHKCGKEITDDVRLAGQWVPRKPESGLHRGYRISQLSYVMLNAAQIVAKYLNYDYKSDFWNLVIAIAFSDSQDNLSRELVLAAMKPPLGGYRMSPHHDGTPTTMGIDVGKNIHIVIRRPHPLLPGRKATVWLEETPDWNRLGQLMYQFNVVKAVIDAHPEDRKAYDFAMEHYGRVFRAEYTDSPDNGIARWDPPPGTIDGDYMVKVHRTMALDADRDRFTSGTIGMPLFNGIVDTFMAHCEKIFRQPVYQQLEGSDTRLVSKYEWVAVGPDHFRHASGYEYVAGLHFDPSTTLTGLGFNLDGVKTKRPD